MLMRRVVVTGMGAVSPLGVGVERFWNNLVNSKSGIRRVDRFNPEGFACQVAAQVPSVEEDPEGGFDPLVAMPTKEVKRVDLFIRYALVAAKEAIEQAGWQPHKDTARQRTATIIASGVGGLTTMTSATKHVEANGPRRLSPFIVPSFLANLAAGQVSITHGFKGPLGTPVTACAASVQALGDAARLIRADEADVAVAGGAEASIDPVSFAGFSAARALSSSYNDTPSAASRPFDKARDGFVMGEGAAILLLEERQHAIERGAEIICELSGYGTSADAHHVTAGPEDGSGALQAMQLALAQSSLSPEAIGYVNAHSTSTPLGDLAELAALTRLFPTRGKTLAVSSTKSATGHLLGATGALEAIAAIKALTTGTLPPTLNLQDPEVSAGNMPIEFDLVPESAVKRELSHVMSNGFGFGGVNAAIVFSSTHP